MKRGEFLRRIGLGAGAVVAAPFIANDLLAEESSSDELSKFSSFSDPDPDEFKWHEQGRLDGMEINNVLKVGNYYRFPDGYSLRNGDSVFVGDGNVAFQGMAHVDPTRSYQIIYPYDIKETEGIGPIVSIAVIYRSFNN